MPGITKEERARRRELRHRFEYHPPSSSFVQRDHANARTQVLRLVDHFDKALPEGREKRIAFTKLEEALFWANASIARHQLPAD